MSGYRHSNETKEIMRQKAIGRYKGRILTEEHKRKISESGKGEKCYWFGKKLTEEHKKKLSLAKKGKKQTKKHIENALIGRLKIKNKS